MTLSKDAQNLRNIIENAIKDHEINRDEYEQIIHMATGHRCGGDAAHVVRVCVHRRSAITRSAGHLCLIPVMNAADQLPERPLAPYWEVPGLRAVGYSRDLIALLPFLLPRVR